jgi:hypothetical protein
LSNFDDFNSIALGAFSMIPRSNKTKHSLGTLRKAEMKTKPKSLDLIGELRLQRHTFEAIAEKFQATGQDEIVCGIAGWGYCENGEPYLTIQLSPPYQATKTPQHDILDAIFGGEGEQ